MPVGRAKHGSAVLGDFLYVFGGQVGGKTIPKQLLNEGSFTTSVMKAPILPSGQLGPWSNDRLLPQFRSYISNSTVALNDMVYLVGGTDGLEDLKKKGTKYKTVLISKPGANGVLEPWIESMEFPGPGLSCFTVAATPGFLHIIGGNTEALEPTGNVITGVLAADGTIASWEPGPPLPTALWFHHSTVASGRVWTWGGLTTTKSSSASNAVYSSVINGTGRLSPWRKESTTLPDPIYRGANAVAGPFLMTFCVSYVGGKTSNDVVFSYLSPQGLSPFTKLPTALPVQIYTACAPDFRRGTIYLPGGQTEYSDVGMAQDVIYFRLTKSARDTIQTLNTREEIAQSSEINNSSPAPATSRVPAGAGATAPGPLPGFLPYDQARRQLLANSGKPLVAYFHMDGSAPSEAQKQRMAQDPGLPGLTQRAIFAWVDVRQSPQIAQQFGIFRAPTWILYDPQGRELGRAARALTSADIAAGIQSVK